MLVTCIGATAGSSSILMLPTLVSSIQKSFSPSAKVATGGLGRLVFQALPEVSMFWSAMNASMAATDMSSSLAEVA